MNMPIDIPHELYEDEIVTFLADRYRTSADNIVGWFLVQDGLIDDPDSKNRLLRLEENEMEMLRGLTCGMFTPDNVGAE